LTELELGIRLESADLERPQIELRDDLGDISIEVGASSDLCDERHPQAPKCEHAQDRKQYDNHCMAEVLPAH
jgi:hypothetical protein